MTLIPLSGTPADQLLDRLIYDGKPVRRRGEWLNLRSLWFVAGRPQKRRPRDWLALPETQSFCSSIRTTRSAPSATTSADIDGMSGIEHVEADCLLMTIRGRKGGMWAHWQLALVYASHLSPALHAWCSEVVRSRMEGFNIPSAAATRSMEGYLEDQFNRLHRRFDIVDRHAGDLMFLAMAGHELMFGERRPFSGRSQVILRAVVAGLPFVGNCPCCRTRSVLSPEARPVAGAQFDHFFDRALNRPEHGWLICKPCHEDLSRGGYLIRFSRIPEFRGFQAAVLAFMQAQYRSSE
jgi:hypothetical protein